MSTHDSLLVSFSFRFFLAPNENNSNNKNDTKRGRRAQLRPPLSLSLSLARFPNDWNLCSVHQLETRIDRYISDEKEKEPRPIPRRCRLTNAYEILEKKRKKESRQFINWNGDDRPQLRRHHGPMRGEERAFNGPIRVSGSLSLSLSLFRRQRREERPPSSLMSAALLSLYRPVSSSQKMHTKKTKKQKQKPKSYSKQKKKEYSRAAEEVAGIRRRRHYDDDGDNNFLVVRCRRLFWPTDILALPLSTIFSSL